MKQMISLLEEELRLAMLNSDVEKLNELIDDSLLFSCPDGSLATKQMDLDVHKSRLQKMTELMPSEQEIQVHDNFAVVTVKMKMTGTFGETDISGQYRYLRIWSKSNNKWKVCAGSVVQISG